MGDTLLGRGIYDVSEVAGVLRVQPETLARWTTSSGSRRAILEPSGGGAAFTFEDLVSLLVVAELWRRKVPTEHIRRGMELLGRKLGTDRPFARREAYRGLATVGRGLFADLDEWVDIGQGGQGAFQEVVGPLLHQLKFDVNGAASEWRPREHVSLNPHVQAGAACVDGRRVTTGLIRELVAAGEDPADVAADYDLSENEVAAALAFERELAAA